MHDRAYQPISALDHLSAESVHRRRDPYGPSVFPEALSQPPGADFRFLTALVAAVDELDYVRAVAIVRAGWFDLVRADRPTLRGLLRRIPSGVLRESPLLAMLAGLVHYGVPCHRIRAVRLFLVTSRAAAAGKRDIDTVDRVLILTSASVAYRLIDHRKHGVNAARHAMKILHWMPEAERDRVPMLPRLYARLGTTLYYGGQVVEALDAFEHGLASIPRHGCASGFLNLSMLAGIHALRGELRETQEYLELARDEPWRKVVRSGSTDTFYRLAEAVVALERFDPAGAQRHLVATMHDRRTIEHWIPIAITEAMAQLVGGRPGAALAGLDAFVTLRRKEGRTASAKAELAPTRALLHLALGNPGEALTILRRDAAPGARTSIGLARAELSLDRYGAALQHLRAAADFEMSQRLAADMATVEAAVLLRFSSRARVRGAVDHLGHVLAATGQRLPVVLVPEADFQQLRSALLAAGHDAVVAGLPARSLFPDPDPATALTEREHAVLRELLRTPSTAQIAAELFVSVNTVKTQLKSLYRKLEVTSRDEAIAVALDRHLVGDPEL